MSRGEVLSLFDYSTTAVRPWLAAGYRCVCVDAQHKAGREDKGNLALVGQDIRDIRTVYGPLAIVMAFPPLHSLGG